MSCSAALSARFFAFHILGNSHSLFGLALLTGLCVVFVRTNNLACAMVFNSGRVYFRPDFGSAESGAHIHTKLLSREDWYAAKYDGDWRTRKAGRDLPSPQLEIAFIHGLGIYC